MVSERGMDVLRVIVQDYVASSEPVGSKSIVERHDFDVSAATIRGDMALLEDEELIIAPHTSSGRIPTDKGYRVYVDRLQGMQPLSSAQRHAIQRFLDDAGDLDDALARTVRMLAQVTNQVALVQYPSLARSRVRRVELIAIADSKVLLVLILDSGRVEQRVVDAGQQVTPAAVTRLGHALSDELDGTTGVEATALLEAFTAAVAQPMAVATARVAVAIDELLQPARSDRFVLAGTSHLVRSESDFHGTLTPVLDAIEEQVTLLRLIEEMQADVSGVATSIGRENSAGLEETSIVASGYGPDGSEVARIGVLGPTRMDYASNMTAVRAVARYLTRLLSEDQ